jgi:hypothetical protein
MQADGCHGELPPEKACTPLLVLQQEAHFTCVAAFQGSKVDLKV